MPITRVGAAAAAQLLNALEQRKATTSPAHCIHTDEVCGFREMWTQICSGLKIDPPIVRQL